MVASDGWARPQWRGSPRRGAVSPPPWTQFLAYGPMGTAGAVGYGSARREFIGEGPTSERSTRDR